MLKIRLTRTGKKNSPSYRVVVADKQRAVKRKFIEIIGNYNPTLTPKELVIDKDRAIFWIERGAQPSDTVNNLMVRLGILGEEKKINKVYGKKLTKKAIKAGPQEPKKEEAPVEEAEEIVDNVPEEAETNAEVEPDAVKETPETPDKEVTDTALVDETTEDNKEESK